MRLSLATVISCVSMMPFFVASMGAKNIDFKTAGNLAAGINRILVVQEEVCEENGIAVTSSDSHYKPGVINVLTQESTHVVFTASQIFDGSKEGGTWTSVMYTNENGDLVCEQKSQTPMGYKRSFKAQCDDNGVAFIDVYVHSNDWTSSNRVNPDAELCESWPSASESPMSNVELFSYRVACGECDSCSPPPSIEVPFDPEDDVCEGEGVNVRYKDADKYQAGAISILQQTSSEVIFTLSQVYSQAAGGSLVSVVYKDPASESWTCDNNGSPLAYMNKRGFKASCDESTGVAVVDVYVHNPEWTSDMVNPRYSNRPGDCAMWTTQSSPSGVALFSYELSCGVCADCLPPPAIPPTCPEENKLVATIGETTFPKWPITITSRDEFSVSFFVEQTWTEKATIFTQFDHDVLGTSQCYQSTDVEKNSREEFTAICMPSSRVAMVHLWVVDEAFSSTRDTAVVPECCYSDNIPDHPAVQYTFLISCVPLCPETSRRGLLRGSATKTYFDD